MGLLIKGLSVSYFEGLESIIYSILFSILIWALRKEPLWDRFCTFAEFWSLWPKRCCFSRQNTWKRTLVPRPLTPLQRAAVLQQSGCVSNTRSSALTLILVTALQPPEEVSWWSVSHCFLSQSPQFYTEGILSLITLREMCLNLQGDYVEKWVIVQVSLHKHHF